MAQVLVTKDATWYQGIASLKNISEKKLELRLLKCTTEIFKGYHGFQSGFTFSCKINSDKAAPDVLLIAQDFSQWVIVELELIGKPLGHTKKQLTVFCNPNFDVDLLVKHCLTKEPELAGKEAELKKLFTNKAPSVLVVFDTYNQGVLSEISQNFDCKICVLEVYRTIHHEFELYRMSGDYPYIYSDFCYLKHNPNNPDIYTIARPELFTSITQSDIKIYHRNFEIEAKFYKSGQRSFIKVPQNPFEPGCDLKIFKSVGDKLIVEKL